MAELVGGVIAETCRRTEVAYFFAIDDSKSSTSWRVSSNCFTARFDPAFESSTVMSSLPVLSINPRRTESTYLVMSTYLAVKCHPTFHSAGNTLPVSVSCV